MSFATYMIGFLILLVGVVYAANLMNVPSTWITAGVVILTGIGLMTAVTKTRTRDHR